MPFDPDAYLAKKAGGGGGFNPDAYLASKSVGKVSETVEPPQVLQEMHPDFTTADRLVVKNFAANPEQAVSYLQRRHPNLEVTGEGGEIRARAKGSAEPYKVLDPQQGFIGSFTNPMETLRDVGDIGYDALAGAGTTAASAAAGLAGGAGTFGVGAIPAAMGGGAAAGVGLEGVRQGIGGMLGVNQDADLLNVGLAGVGGAVSPLLFGTGATAGQIGAKALESGVAEEALAASQRGLAGKARDAVMPGVKKGLTSIASKLTGVPKDAIEGLATQYGNVQAMEKDPMAVTNLTTQVADKIAAPLREAKQTAWNTYEQALSEVPGKVDVSAAKDALKAAIADAEGKAAELKTPAAQDLVTELKGAFGKYFTYQAEEPTVTQAATGLLDAAGQPLTRQMAGAPQVVQKEVTELAPVAAAQLERQLSELADLGAGGKSGIGNRFGQNATFNEKVIGQAAARAKTALGDTLGEALPPEALAAKATYGEAANLERELQPLFEGTDKAFATLRNLGRVANKGKQETLNRLDEATGAGVIPAAKLSAAYSHFASPSLNPLSAAGGSGLARTAQLSGAGALAGEAIDRAYGGHSHTGAKVGGLIGGALGSPAALRAYIWSGLKAGGALNALPNAAAPTAATSAWNMLQH